MRNTAKIEVLLNENYFDDTACVINEFLLEKEVEKTCEAFFKFLIQKYEAFLSKCGV